MIPLKICILSSFVWLKSILLNLVCVSDLLFSERLQSTLFQFGFFFVFFGGGVEWADYAAVQT